VRVQVRHVSVFRVLLFLICLMDQKIEAMRIRVFLRDCVEMTFVEADHVSHRVGKSIQKAPALVAKGRIGLLRRLHFMDPVFAHTQMLDLHKCYQQAGFQMLLER